MEISEVGAPNAIAAVGRFLEHSNKDVRKAAGDAFEILTPKGNEQAFQLLQPLFKKKNLKIVVSAIDALGRVSGRGNSPAWEVANRFLTPPHDKPAVRKAAVIAIGRICVLCNDEDTERILVGRLGDLDPDVKETAALWLDVYRGKVNAPPSLPVGKKSFRGAASSVIASRRLSSTLMRPG